MRESVEVEGRTQHLTFSVAGTDYGISILRVKEILQYENETRVPGTPPSIRGVVNIRGGAVPVLDLAVKFGGRETAPTARTCVLVVETAARSGGLAFGVIADRVNEVVDLAASDIEPPLRFGDGHETGYLSGMAKVGRGFVLLLDVDATLSGVEVDRVASLIDEAENS
jgi:purine-binding chemotaxis protein CheW